jgi:DNA-binding NarL/FixJ family response regulator
MKKIAIADDHPMMRGALILAVTTTFGKAEILESSSIAELMAQLREAGEADLVLLDLRMHDANGFEGLRQIRAGFPSTPVVVVSALHESRLVSEALSLGAMGFIPKSTPRHEIVAALQRIAAGGVYVPPNAEPGQVPSARADAESEFLQRVQTLTPQQRRVLQLLGTGKLNKEIAYELDIAETTVKAHVSSILHKLKVYSRTQAVVMASRAQPEGFKGLPDC